MKKFIISFILTVTIAGLHAQSAKDVFNASEIVWYGLDFTHIKLRGQFTQVGSAGFKSEEEIQDVYFEGWNNIVIFQPEKFDLMKTFHVGSFPYEIKMITMKNANANVKDMFIENSGEGTITEATVKKMVSGYKPVRKTGIGCVFIMESFDKIREEGAMWVTFFDIATQKVLFTERMVEKGGGIGIKNYWIRTVYNALVHIQRSQYKVWKNKYDK